ncbi:MAG TPA: rhodanese-like domain-containing protein [Pyrinomonadaceae bacterium]|nr:rhodanese-like domain-containing protein [Pyrinomonadaceae bacterium]
MQKDILTKKGRLGLFLNIAILLAAVFCAALLVKTFRAEAPPAYKLVPHAKLEIMGVDWTEADQTVVLALSKTCHYCSKSAPFYQRLLQQLTQKPRARLIALFPESQNDGEDYVKGLGLSIQHFKYVSLASLGIRTFPTLALVNKDGIASQVWVGKLGPRKESQVMRALDLADTRSVDEWMIDEKNLGVRLAKREPIVLLDVRHREAYAQEHKAGARNIPLDELGARALDELPENQTLVVYGDDEADADVAYSLLNSQGFSKILILSAGSSPSAQPGSATIR